MNYQGKQLKKFFQTYKEDLKTMAKITLKDFKFYENLFRFILDYKSELEDLSEFIEKKLGQLDEKQEDVKIFLQQLNHLYSKFGASEEVDNYYYDNMEKLAISRDKRLIEFFRHIFEIENNLKG